MSTAKRPACIGGIFYDGTAVGACLILGGRFFIEMRSNVFYPHGTDTVAATLAAKAYEQALKDANPLTPDELRIFKEASDAAVKEGRSRCTIQFLPSPAVTAMRSQLSQKK